MKWNPKIKQMTENNVSASIWWMHFGQLKCVSEQLEVPRRTTVTNKMLTNLSESDYYIS